MRVLISALTFVSAFAFAQEMSVPGDNQCRVQAKEIALKTYQTCVTETRSAKIEQIRQEYQEKLAALKSEYDAQLKELRGQVAAASATPAVAPVEVKEETPSEVPTVIEPVLKDDTVTQENLTLTEPTITLKPAAPVVVPAVVKKQATKKKQPTKKATPVVAQKRAKGEKGVKGIAKTLPAKKKVVETKPASSIATEAEVVKVAPIQESELEKNVITKAPLSEEQLQVVDPTLGAHAAEIESAQQ